MADRFVLRQPAPCRVILVCLVTICCGVLSPVPLSGSELRQTPIVRAVQAASPAVVNIRGEKTLLSSPVEANEGEAARRVNGMGTGVIIDPRGYVITNHHVIDGVREIQVTLADGTRYTARLIERDSETDLAIIKIDPAEPLPLIDIGTSEDLMPGETVVAVGNAYGYEHTVTLGIISALHRPVPVTDAQYYDDLIQTDASINPGNSGGPLLNIDGEMIGINVAVRAGAQGIGFAIPVDKAMAVAANLLAAHSLRKAWHGVEVAADPSHTGRGLVVRSVAEASPAEKAGLQPGDVIAAAGDLQIARELDFRRAMLELNVGDELDLFVRRGEETLSLTLELAQVPGNLRPAVSSWELLGLELRPIPTEEFRKKYRSTRYRGGLTVTAVRPNSPAADRGIHRGDVLVGMHIWETISLENVDYIVNRPDLATFNPVKFYVLRGNHTLFGNLPIPLAMRETSQR